jgi:hypothetical protein
MLMPPDPTRRGLLRSALGDWLERLMMRTEDRVIGPEIRFLADCTRSTSPSSFSLTYLEN